MQDSLPVRAIDRVRQHPERGAYDRAAVLAVLDAGLVAHVAFIHDGRPMVMPMTYGHDGDRMFIHGSRTSRIAQSIAGADVSIGVTVVDGLVVGRSMFETSMNYRSVVVHGRARRIDDDADRLHALRCFAERMLPGRWEEVPLPRANELKATAILEVEIAFASAKVRSGPAVPGLDVAADNTWFGVVPLATTWGRPVADGPAAALPLPASLAGFA